VLTALAAFAKYHIVFNVFRYITFRTAMALVTALVLSLCLGPWMIRKLREPSATGPRPGRRRWAGC
jgi:phospho-N-acetylmuramoyl-pentapeptide-transferase